MWSLDTMDQVSTNEIHSLVTKWLNYRLQKNIESRSIYYNRPKVDMDASIYAYVTPYVNDHNYGDEINYPCSSHTSMWFLQNLIMSVPFKCFFLWISNYQLVPCLFSNPCFTSSNGISLLHCKVHIFSKLSQMLIFKNIFVQCSFSYIYRTHPYCSCDHIHVLYNVPRMKNPLVIWNHGEIKTTSSCSLGKQTDLHLDFITSCQWGQKNKFSHINAQLEIYFKVLDLVIK